MNTTARVLFGFSLTLLSGPLLAQTPEARLPLPKPKSFGTDQISYYRIAASEFTPVDTLFGELYSDEWHIAPKVGQFQRFSSPSPGQFIASPHLPSGAVITYFELDSCDTDPGGDVEANLFLCDILGNGGFLPIQQLSSNDNAISCGYTSADVSAAGIQVDNYRNQITIMVQTAGTEATRFAGVILGYKLQVSPPPPFADFNDVPTNHPYFQFIEALSNSGITAGCGNGDYCPDRAITRGEMAVFLAKALGLQWP